MLALHIAPKRPGSARAADRRQAHPADQAADLDWRVHPARRLKGQRVAELAPNTSVSKTLNVGAPLKSEPCLQLGPRVLVFSGRSENRQVAYSPAQPLPGTIEEQAPVLDRYVCGQCELPVRQAQGHVQVTAGEHSLADDHRWRAGLPGRQLRRCSARGTRNKAPASSVVSLFPAAGERYREFHPARTPPDLGSGAIRLLAAAWKRGRPTSPRGLRPQWLGEHDGTRHCSSTVNGCGTAHCGGVAPRWPRCYTRATRKKAAVN